MDLNKKPQEISAELTGIVEGDVFCDIFHRAAYSTDASIYQIIPLCVVAPKKANDVIAAVEYARQNKISIVARGAGSGLAGESLGAGIVLDTRRYMNKILGLRNNGTVVVCQPGVVLDNLNEYLARHGKKIGPDPSSGSRATVGGCVANNATGAHSLEFGYIGDYVVSIKAVLADGSSVEFQNDIEPAKTEDRAVKAIAGQCEAVLSKNADVIRNALPRTKRNRSGYNIANICHNGMVELAKLLAGSEGTLAVFTEITLKTVDLPASKGLLQLEFESMEKMALAVPVIVDSGASACELMDQTLMRMAARALPEYHDILPVCAAAGLLVEHIGESEEEVRNKIEKTDGSLGSLASGRRIVFDEIEQKRLWKSRKDAVPLLYRVKGRKQPVPFIEDTSVDNTKLAEYISGLDRISRKYDIPMVYYGHAGDGQLHIRPYMDLATQEDVRKMQLIADEVFTLAWSLGGSISGEHADGLVRAAFIKRQYGAEFYEVLRQIKKVFDPENLLNPGKIINDEPDVMIRNLRAGYRPLGQRLKTNLLFEGDDFLLEIEQCSGCGSCLDVTKDMRMCPVFRAVGEELACSRAKANLLRFWITGLISDKDFESQEFKQIIDLCVNCGTCAVQCPSGVNISRLMVEARAEYAKRKGLRGPAFILGHNRYLSMLASSLAPVANFVMSLAFFKWFLEKTVGLERKRIFPRFKFGTFLNKGRKCLKRAGAVKNPIDKVAYFVDTFANYNDHKLGFAVVKTLQHNNIEVVLPRQRPAPVPAMVYGDVKTARRDLEYSVKHLADAVRKGYKIVCSEPSAALCLKHELGYFIKSEDAELVSANTYELMSYLRDLLRQGKLKSADRISGEFAYHLPCHLCALGVTDAGIEVLRKLSAASVTDLSAGCCGLAGTFGMQKKNYELSVKITESFAAAIAASSAEQILSECSACRMQIEQLTHKKAEHPIKILAKAYGL